MDLSCVSMQVSFDNEEYKENVNLTKAQFYDILESSNVFPKTSQPTPFDFENLLRKFKGSGDECVIVTISSALSGTYQTAAMVSDMMEYSDCYVVDSLNATGGERLLVHHAVNLRDEGKSAKEIFDELEALKGKIKLYACVDTLEYLYRGGRLSKAAYAMGTLANIKPVILVSDEGNVEVESKELSMKKGISSVCKMLQEYEPDTGYPIYIMYSKNSDNGELLAENVRKAGYEVLPENVVNIGATIGAHVGANACGVVYVAK